MERRTLNGWLVSRCAGSVSALSSLARQMFTLAFQSLSEGPNGEKPNTEAEHKATAFSAELTWGLHDVLVNGLPSMAICAQIGGQVWPVFVVPVPGLIIHNASGDALAIERHPLMGAEPSKGSCSGPVSGTIH
jgi:hypothetical protein